MYCLNSHISEGLQPQLCKAETLNNLKGVVIQMWQSAPPYLLWNKKELCKWHW